MYDPTKDMIDPPSRLTLHIAEMLTNKKLSLQPGFLQRFYWTGKLRNDSSLKYKEFYAYVKGFKMPDDLVAEIEKIMGMIAESELYMAFLHKPGETKLTVLTREDEKVALLENVRLGKSDAARFRKQFGHWSEKPFEIRERPYRDYSDQEIFELSKGLRAQERTTLPNEMKKKNPDLFSVYAALREDLKDCAIKIIDDMRQRLDEQDFDKSLDEISKKLAS